MSITISQGQVAPDFKLPSHRGGEVALSDFRGVKHVVLFFYPKDESPGCTKEACSFRDRFEDFSDAGAEVIGISADSESSHHRFAEKHSLPFHLLSDRGGKVRAAYGIKKTLGLLPGRVTFLIDKDGLVRHVFSSQLNVYKHVDDMLAQLKSLG